MYIIVICILIVINVAEVGMIFVLNRANIKNKMMYRKMDYYFELMYQWLSCKIRGESVIDRLYEKGYYEIAIYGMSKMGKCLYEELSKSKSKCKVVFVTDQKEMNAYECYRLPDSELPNVDVMIVTVINEYLKIKEEMQKRVNCPIISLEELLY